MFTLLVVYVKYYEFKFSLTLFLLTTENLLQSSVDDSWTDSNLNRVSVIQFQEETKAEEDDDEAAAERRVSCVISSTLNRCIELKFMVLLCPLWFQGLQRRATPHPSELKVMKKVIEERRNEAYTSRSDGADKNEDQRVQFY